MSLTLAPRPPVRHASSGDSPADMLRAWLAQLPSANLSPFASASLLGAPGLCASEAHAASRAATCPDLFLIHSPDLASRDRAIVGMISAIPDERVLVLSPDPMTADRLVERLVKTPIRVVRALADEENPARPSPVVTRATSLAFLSAQAEQLRRQSLEAAAAAAERFAAVEAEIAASTATDDLAGRMGALERESNELRVQCDEIERQVRCEAETAGTPLHARIEHRQTESRKESEDLNRQRAALATARKDKEGMAADLRKQLADASADAAKKAGFLSRWLGKTKPSADPTELTHQLHQVEQELTDAAAGLSALEGQASAKHLEAQSQLIENEITARRSDLDARLERLSSERSKLAAELESRKMGSTRRSHEELIAAREAAEQEISAVRKRAADLARSAEDAARSALAEVRVIVGVPGCLRSDPAFDSASSDPQHKPPFDVLVLDRAEELGEADFARLGRLARRWVLAGDLTPPDHASNGRASRSGRNGRAVEIPFAARLAVMLDREPWAAEAGRLVCRLIPLTADERRRMTSEPLLDRPEIELRFAASPDGAAALAEIAFPIATGIAAAKTFLVQELGEILLRPCGELSWQVTPETIVACWSVGQGATGASQRGPAASTEMVWIELAPGVREQVVGAGASAFTASVSFDVATGWSPESAEAWLQSHLPINSSSRLAVVSRRS